MFFKRKKQTIGTYEKAGKIPMIRSSICTGEQVAGFKDPVTGKFDDLMVIRNDADLKRFLSQYQIEEADIRREW